jgi:AcrR family transcriptional regulator
VAETDPVIRLLEHLPPRPSASADRMLDATERCLARYGIRRTSMTDIAREMHVARTTLYRQVGSVEEAIALVASRQLHRFLDELVDVLARPGGARAEDLVAAIGGAVRFTRSHPVALRVLNDEPEILGSIVARDLGPYAAQIADALAPVLRHAMDGGVIRRADPLLAAQWLVRVLAVLVALPPEDLDRMLDYALRPVLEGIPRESQEQGA